MWHVNVAHPILYDLFRPDRGQSCPFAVARCLGSTPLVHFELADFTGEAVGRDTVQGFAAYIAKGGSGMRADVPVVNAAK